MARPQRASVEIEIKLCFPSARAARLALRKLGFAVHARRGLERNVLYDSPRGELRAQGIAVRHRVWHGRHTITYKGPVEQASGVHKRRMEHETTVEEPGAILASWEAAGLVATFRYEKYRTVYVPATGAGHAMLDETPLGVFLELEGSAHWIDGTAAALGFTPEQYIQMSYPALQAQACRAMGKTFCDLLFSTSEKFS